MHDVESLTREVTRLSRAVRFALAAVVVGISYPNIHLALLIDAFRNLFRDMLNGQPLPGLTQFVIDHQNELIGCSFVFPIAAVATVFLGKIAPSSVYAAGILVLATLAQFFLTISALFLPLISITTNMSGAA